MKRLFAFVFLLCLLAAPAWAYTDVPGTSAVNVSKVAGAPDKKVSVLFLGNSYTYFNDLPKMLADIASGDADSHVQYEIQSVTKAGGTLQALWDEGDGLKALQARKWDYVVLQEQSFWAVLPENVEGTAAAAQKWNAEIAKAGAKPLIFVTWARQPDSFWYTDSRYNFLHNPKYMQQKFDDASAALAKELGAQTVPVGDAWAALTNKDRKWPLYREDSHHPTVAGSYLAALVFYKTISGRSPETSTFVPQGVNADSAAILRKTAATFDQKADTAAK